VRQPSRGRRDRGSHAGTREDCASWRGPTWRLPIALRRSLLLLPPLLRAGLEVLHPQPEANARAVMDVSTWFAAFHVIQLVLIGLIALSVLLLADGFRYASAWAMRLGIGTFLVFFSAYDAVAGIGAGSQCEARETCRPRSRRPPSTWGRTGLV
jgi:hypothetical protein